MTFFQPRLLGERIQSETPTRCAAALIHGQPYIERYAPVKGGRTTPISRLIIASSFSGPPVPIIVLQYIGFCFLCIGDFLCTCNGT